MVMSRSRKKENIRPVASSDGMKEWKSQVNRCLRRKVKVCLAKLEVDDIVPTLDKKDVSDVWGAPADGYQYVHESDVGTPYKFHMK
jgi:hypothetical protein